MVKAKIEHALWPAIEISGEADLAGLLRREDLPRLVAKFLGGTATGTCRFDTRAFGRKGRAVAAGAKVNRFRLRGDLDVDPSMATWNVEAVGTLRARGLARPLLWIFGKKLVRGFERQIAAAWEQAPEAIRRLRERLAEFDEVVHDVGGPDRFVHGVLWDIESLDLPESWR